MDSPARDDGFGAFFKRYTRTWQHALATAALTAFGTLTVVDRLFAAVAVLAYVLPPVVLYLRRSSASTAAARSPEGTAPAGRDVDANASPADGPTRGPEPASNPEPNPGRDSNPEPDPGRDRSLESDPGRDSNPESEPGSEPCRDPRPEPEAGSHAGSRRTWTAAAVPTGEDLLAVAVAGGDAYAVGAEGTVLVDREPSGGDGAGDDEGVGWTVAVPGGVRARSNPLRGVAAVEGGGVWIAGDGGTVGRLDPSTGRHVDRSAPDGDTTTVVDVAAAGPPGDETVLLADGSGRVRRGRYRDGTVTWAAPVTPGSGSSVAGVAFADRATAYVCDTAQRVFETADGGRTFEAVGPDGADGTFTDVASGEPGTCVVAADDGVVHRYDAGAWTPERLGEAPVRAVATADGLVVACDGDGAYERPADGAAWERSSTPATGPLRGVAAGPSRVVAVGDDGTVVERDPDAARDGGS